MEPRDPLSIRLARRAGVLEAGRVLRDFATYLPAQLVPAIAGFIVLPLLANKLAPTELGVLAIAQTLVALGWILVGSWLAAAIIRQLPEHRARATTTVFTATLERALGLVGLALGLFAGGLALAGMVSGAVADNFGLLVAAAAGLVLQNIAVSLFAGGLRPRGYVVIDVLARTLGVGIGVLLVFQGYKVHGYLFGLAASSLVVGAIGLAFGWPRGPSRERTSALPLRAWLAYGVPGSISALGTWGLGYVDRYLLALLEDTSAVGVYTVGNVLGDKIVTIPAAAFLTASGPLLITAFERHGRVEVERLMRAYTRFLLLIGLPIVALAAAAAGPTVSLISGTFDYSGAEPVVPLVAVGSLVYALSIVGYTGLVIAKRTWPMVYAAAFGLCANVAANLLLIPALGIKGAAVAAPIGMAAWLAATQRWARAYASWRFPTSTLLRAAIAAGLAYLAAAQATELSESASVQVGLAAVTVVAVAVAVLALLGEHWRGEARA